MFTGLVEHIGSIQSIKRGHSSLQMTLESQFDGIQHGESIAVEGVCLTVIDHNHSIFTVELSSETLRLTTLGQKCPGDTVNLERALMASSRMGGHMVSGHIDSTVLVQNINSEGEFTRMRFTVERSTDMSLLCEKGSVAINGVSLTVNAIGTDTFDVMLIPHTYSVTTLSNLQVDQPVNIEFDMLAKMIRRQINLMNQPK